MSVTLGGSESQDSWLELLRQLLERGLTGMRLVIADGHAPGRDPVTPGSGRRLRRPRGSGDGEEVPRGRQGAPRTPRSIA
ncbi:transposase [Myxococcus sp. XM-1-1-1]|nr:transposase [Myxococcus sp. XM-1-1-1]